jgi:protein phosphatase
LTTNLRFYEATDIGAREHNQDYYAHHLGAKGSCFVLADGLGGHQRGDIASQAFCEALIDVANAYTLTIYEAGERGISAYLRAAYETMQKRVLAECGSIDTHTTFALVWLNDKQLITAHVGDSRIYRINAQSVLWRTPDHTPVQALFEEGKIAEDEIGNHPLQNRLLRTVNLREAPDIDIFFQPPLKTDETLVLCTDGFWTVTPFAQIVEMANALDCETRFAQRIAEIAENPNADNITVQVIKLI